MKGGVGGVSFSMPYFAKKKKSLLPPDQALGPQDIEALSFTSTNNPTCTQSARVSNIRPSGPQALEMRPCRIYSAGAWAGASVAILSRLGRQRTELSHGPRTPITESFFAVHVLWKLCVPLQSEADTLHMAPRSMPAFPSLPTQSSPLYLLKAIKRGKGPPLYCPRPAFH